MLQSASGSRACRQHAVLTNLQRSALSRASPLSSKDFVGCRGLHSSSYSGIAKDLVRAPLSCERPSLAPHLLSRACVIDETVMDIADDDQAKFLMNVN